MANKENKFIQFRLKTVYELARKFRRVHQRPDLYLGDARIAHDYLAKKIKEKYPEEIDFRLGPCNLQEKDTPDSYPTYEEFLKGVSG